MPIGLNDTDRNIYTQERVSPKKECQVQGSQDSKYILIESIISFFSHGNRMRKNSTHLFHYPEIRKDYNLVIN